MIDPKSIDKLVVLLSSIDKIPRGVLQRVSTVSLTWEVKEGVVVPCISVALYPESQY